MQRIIISYFVLLITLASSCLIHADFALTHKPEVRHFINYMVKKHGFNRGALLAVMIDVKLQPEIIKMMDKPYESKPWDIYKRLFLTRERLEGGLAFWRANYATLLTAEKQYQVPMSIIIAIIGVETIYGKHQGSWRVLDALSTLAFNYPKRSAFFTKELAEYLLLCREHHVPPQEYMGSYAGAMGQPQFMPSSYRYYARDFTKNPRKDLMHDNKAVIASVANYLHQHGWQMYQGIAARTHFYGKSDKQINTANKYAAYSLNQLMAGGVRPEASVINQKSKFGLIDLITSSGEEFWLTYPNFYVITRYNSSPQYAMVVYLLSLQLKQYFHLRS